MGPLHHRRPGVAGRVLDDASVLCTLIPDGIHVDPVMVRLAARCLGVARTALVTDSVAAAGMPDGEYAFDGRRVIRRDGVVRDADGRLAGSCLTMAEAASSWQRMVPAVGPATLAAVIAGNPARAIGRDDLGAIAPGRQARFGVLEDGVLHTLHMAP